MKYEVTSTGWPKAILDNVALRESSKLDTKRSTEFSRRLIFIPESYTDQSEGDVFRALITSERPEPRRSAYFIFRRVTSRCFKFMQLPVVDFSSSMVVESEIVSGERRQEFNISRDSEGEDEPRTESFMRVSS